MAVIGLDSLLRKRNILLGPQKAREGMSPSERLGIGWGSSSYAAIRMKSNALLALRGDLADAFSVIAMARAGEPWLFDAIGCHKVPRSAEHLDGSEFRRIALQSPEIAVLYDDREISALAELEAWDDLLTVAPDRAGRRGATRRYASRRDAYPWFALAPEPIGEEGAPAPLVATPGIRSVEQLQEQFAVGPEDMIKSLVAIATVGGVDRPMICALRGDHDLSLDKVRALTGATSARLATSSEVLELTGSPVGFCGPFATSGIPDVAFDASCPFDRGVICGQHQEDHHLVGAMIGRDIPAPPFVFDIAVRSAGPSAEAGAFRVIWLRTYYEALVLDLLANDIEASDRPFNAVVVPARPADLDDARALAQDMADVRTMVYLDDRSGSFGSRLADWELLAPAATVIVGRGFADGRVEASFGSSVREEYEVAAFLKALVVARGRS